MHGLKLRLEGLYFTSFRKPTSTSLILTYSVPPYTTIRGMLSNALGLRRDDLTLQEWFRIGIKPVRIGDTSREMAKILKLKGTGRKFQKVFPSSPMFKEFLVNPVYEVFLVDDEEKIERIYKALLNPVRPLYFGASDDLIDIEVSEPTEVEVVEAEEVHSVVEGIHENCMIEKIPYKFHQRGRKFSVEYKTISVPRDGAVSLRESVKCIKFDKEAVWVV
jgi:CRISPR-associated protein Cas5h